MARMAEAEWVGPYHDNGVMSRYDIVCIHTIVGNPPAHAAHFSFRSDGHVFQSRDTYYRSAANWNGNYRIIAFENDDHGPEYGDWDTNNGHEVPPFTDIQCEANAHVLVWCYRTHGIPLVPCPDSKSTSRGVAYHRQGIKGNWNGYAYGGWTEGGEIWTEHEGKVCPGDDRIWQVLNVIIPRARVIAGLPPLEGSDMELTGDSLAMLGDIQYRIASMHAGQYLPWQGIAGAPGGDLTFFQTQSAMALAPTNAMLAEVLATVSDDVTADGVLAHLTEHMDAEMVKIRDQYTAQVAALQTQLQQARTEDREAMETVIRETLPDELAQQVVDEMGKRLQRTV